MKYSSLLALLFLMPLAGSSWCQKQTAPDTIPGPALDRGLQAIQAQNIRADLYFLADDAMRGRNTPSPEQRIAARFLRSRLMRLGFTPGFHESFLWEYNRDRWKLLADEASMTLHMGSTDFKWTLGEDYFLSPTSPAERSISKAGVVYLGTDKTAREWEGELDGAWALVEAPKRISRRLLLDLVGKGAAGVLVMPNLESDTTVVEAHGERFERMLALRMGNLPDKGRAPLVFLSEASAKAIRDSMDESEPGTRLESNLSETCATESVPEVLENVVGIWPGSDPKLKDEVIILSAHYDHIGVSRNGEVNNGADDNGSGTSGMLALSEALAAYGPMRRTIMIQWVSGEEKGLWGSKAWTKDPWLPEGMRPVCNINIDMIGRNAGDELLITPTEKHDEYSWLTRVAEKHRKAEGFKKLKSADDYYRRSDHASYRDNLDIPVIFLFADVHEDYHRVTDTPDKINYDKIERVSRLVLRVLDDLQRDSLED